MSVFVHAQGIKTVHVCGVGWGGGVKKWQNSVHVVVECPLMTSRWPLHVHGHDLVNLSFPAPALNECVLPNKRAL